jgi:hypothetical protein
MTDVLLCSCHAVSRANRLNTMHFTCPEMPANTNESYFPYCRQSKKKSHRGAVTARMIANLLSIAGVDHIITLDLHVCPRKLLVAMPYANMICLPGVSNARIL